MDKFFTSFLLLSSLLLFQVWQPVVFAQQPANNEPSSVYVISIKGSIFDGLAQRMTQKFQQVDKTKAKVVILELDSPGGDLEAVLSICKDVDALAVEGVPVYTYITGYAWGGGALLTLAADKIYMSGKASLGSHEGKISGPFGGNSDEEFLETVRGHFRSYAEKRDYPPALAEAMADANINVTEAIYKGQRIFKTSEEMVAMRSDPNVDLSRLREVGEVVEKGKYLELSAQKAVDYGFCRGIYESREDLLNGLELGQYPVKEIALTSSDQVANLLTNRWIRFALLAIGILGILIELGTPGFGVPGIAGILCFTLFFTGGYLSQMAELWEILLFVGGLAFLALEVFVLPGFGIAGTIGIAMCFIGLLLSFQTFIVPQNQQEIDLFVENLFTITSSLGVDIIAIILLAKYLPEGAPMRLSMKAIQTESEGYTVAVPGYTDLLEQEGVALTSLRPSGRVKIGEDPYDVVTSGDLIDSGTPVRVIEVKGNRIVVEKIVKES